MSTVTAKTLTELILALGRIAADHALGADGGCVYCYPADGRWPCATRREVDDLLALLSLRSVMFFKVLGPGRRSPVAGTLWPQRRRWTPRVAELVRCRSGWHLSTVADLPRRVRVDHVVWEAETDGETVETDGEVIAVRARLIRPVGTLTRPLLVGWAADCADHVAACRADDDVASQAATDAARVWAADPCDAHAAAADAAANAAYAYAAGDATEPAWQGQRLLDLLETRLP